MFHYGEKEHGLCRLSYYFWLCSAFSGSYKQEDVVCSNAHLHRMVGYSKVSLSVSQGNHKGCFQLTQISFPHFDNIREQNFSR